MKQLFKLSVECANYQQAKELIERDDADAMLTLINPETSRELIIETVAGLAEVAKDYELFSEALGNRIKQLQERKKRFDRNIERVRTLMLAALQTVECEKLETPEFTISRRKGPLNVIIEDLDNLALLYPEYFKTELKLDKKRLNDDVRNGVVVEGVTLDSNELIMIKDS